MWYNAWFCVSCKRELSNHAIMYSNGRCPLCGYKGPTACTVVDYIERAYKLVPRYPNAKWWEVWKFFQKRRMWQDSKQITKD